MGPETVLKIKPIGMTVREVNEVCDIWIKEYKKHIDASCENEQLGELLIKRVKRAAELVIERYIGTGEKKSVRQGWADCDPAYYEMESERYCAEDDSLDGEFPLGNKADAEFAVPFFTVEQIVYIQFGKFDDVPKSYYTEPEYNGRIKLGFLFEMQKDWAKAERCYSSYAKYDESIARREKHCREKRIAESERVYKDALICMQSGEADKVSELLKRAVDMKNTDAMVDWGNALIYGTYGISPDYIKGLSILREAVYKYNNSRACMALVELRDKGCLDISGKEAKECCEKAANAGDGTAIIRLEKDFDMRSEEEILTELANKGDIDALWLLHKNALKRYCRDEAAEWYKKALEAGQVDALLFEAEMCSWENSDFYNPELAEKYLKQADGRSCADRNFWLKRN